MQKNNRNKDIEFGKPESPALPGPRPIFFRLKAPKAKTVSLVGEFNNWDPKMNRLERRNDGVWWGTVRLVPGSYQYKFVVDGAKWCEDPLCPDQIPNTFGSINSVCEVVQGDL